MSQETLLNDELNAPQSVEHVIFIDERVQDRAILIAALPASSIWYLIRSDEDALGAMTQALQGVTDLRSIQIIT